jgi:hypothetical protein
MFIVSLEQSDWGPKKISMGFKKFFYVRMDFKMKKAIWDG